MTTLPQSTAITGCCTPDQAWMAFEGYLRTRNLNLALWQLGHYYRRVSAQ